MPMFGNLLGWLIVNLFIIIYMLLLLAPYTTSLWPSLAARNTDDIDLPQASVNLAFLSRGDKAPVQND